MTFYFARVQEDGRLTTPLPHCFATIEEAKKAAPDLLVRLRKTGGKIVLVQVLEEAQVFASVKYVQWTKRGTK